MQSATWRSPRDRSPVGAATGIDAGVTEARGAPNSNASGRGGEQRHPGRVYSSPNQHCGATTGDAIIKAMTEPASKLQTHAGPAKDRFTSTPGYQFLRAKNRE